jgi:UPF0716 family protein affecting phage T7 exclusion
MLIRLLLWFILLEIIEMSVMGAVGELFDDIIGLSIGSSINLLWCLFSAYLGSSYLKKRNLAASLMQAMAKSANNPKEALSQEALKIFGAIALIVPGYLSDFVGLMLCFTRTKLSTKIFTAFGTFVLQRIFSSFKNSSNIRYQVFNSQTKSRHQTKPKTRKDISDKDDKDNVIDIDHN